PWAAENLESSLAGAETFPVTFGKDVVTLVPLRSAARSFRELRRKFVGGQTLEALKAFTDAAGATVYLLRPQRQEPPVAPAAEDAAEASAGGEETLPAGEGDDAEGGVRRRRRRRRGGRGRGEGAADAAEASEA